MHLQRLGPGGDFASRLLEPPDLRDLQALFERARDYFELVTGRPPERDEAQRAFVAGPPSKSVSDKRVVGVFSSGGGLVGVLDSITDWPEAGVWTIGMLLLDPAVRGRGLGTAVLAAFASWAGSEGARTLRTAAPAQHDRGLRFLERAGFSRVSRVENYDAGGARPTILFLEKPLFRGKNAGS